MAFYSGQKVVCVYAGPSRRTPNAPGLPDLVVGKVYTVVRCFMMPTGRFKGDEICHLSEVERSAAAKRIWGTEVGYGTYRFKPAVEQKTDISIFTSLLTPKAVPERV